MRGGDGCSCVRVHSSHVKWHRHPSRTVKKERGVVGEAGDFFESRDCFTNASGPQVPKYQAR